jgi:hypothetical protein
MYSMSSRVYAVMFDTTRYRRIVVAWSRSTRYRTKADQRLVHTWMSARKQVRNKEL